MKLKILPVLVSLAMLPTASFAEEIKANDADADKLKNQTQSSGADGQTLHDLQAKKETIVQPYMPTARDASWRFGLWRTKRGGYYHQGLDFSGAGTNSEVSGDKVLWSSDGELIRKDAAHKVMIVKRDANEDKYVMLHAKRRASTGVGGKVEAGEYAMMMGNTDGSGRGVGQRNTNSDYAKHLHYEYHVKSTSGRQRWVGVGGSKSSTTKGKGVTFHPNTMGRQGSYSGTGYVVTDPTPYLKNDAVFNATYQDAALESYLGTTLRTQYNALYNPTVPLGPIHPRGRKPTKKFANLPVFKDYMSPEDIAAMGGGAVNASLYAGSAGYDINGNLITHGMLASFISASNGADWATLPSAPAAVLSEMTPQEIVKKIRFQRYGNLDWESAMIKLSSKGLLTEYLMMTAEENFLRQQNQRMKNRVELQLATLNQARLFEYNKKIESMNVLAKADSVPRIIDAELQNNQYYSGVGPMPDFDLDNLPADLDGLLEALMSAIALGESHNAGAWNNDSCGISAPSGGKGRDILSMTPVQIIKTYYSYYKGPPQVIPDETPPDTTCASKRILASGKMQTIASTLSEMLMKAPQYANQLYTEENQLAIAKDALLLNSIHKDLKKFLRNGGSDAELTNAMWGIAKTWASVATPDGYPSRYNSYYGGNNSADKKATDATWAVMKRIQQYHRGEIQPTTPTAEPSNPTEGGKETTTPKNEGASSTTKP